MKRPYFLVLTVLFSGCLNTRYTSRTDPGVDFSNYQTFYCLECLNSIDPKRPRYDNEVTRNLIRLEIQKELESRGYLYQVDESDLLIEFDLIIEDHIDTVAQRTTNYRYWKGFETDAYNYKIGTLIINMIDSKEGQVIWQGTAESFLDIEPENVERTVRKAVKNIFREYPYTVDN